jgi:hypothetical protein
MSLEGWRKTGETLKIACLHAENRIRELQNPKQE